MADLKGQGSTRDRRQGRGVGARRGGRSSPRRGRRGVSRPAARSNRPNSAKKINSIACDHTDDQAVEAVFRRGRSVRPAGWISWSTSPGVGYERNGRGRPVHLHRPVLGSRPFVALGTRW